MSWSRLLRFALTSLTTNKVRTLLALLGIVIGVGAVIIMIGLGRGAQEQTAEQIGALGTNLIFIRPGATRGMVRSGEVQTLVAADARAIAELRPTVVAAVPEATTAAQVKYFNRNTSTTIVGTTLDYFPARNFAIVEGQAWTTTDERIRARVAVLGAEVAQLLFGEGQAVGKRIKIRGVAFEVVGVLESKGGGGWMNPDDQILAQLLTVQKRLGAGTHLRGISVQVASVDQMAAASQEISELLRRRHRIGAGRQDDFSLMGQDEILRARSQVAETFTFLLAGIALVSLVVGGIGIMNIMLVSVAERTREIGVLKALGARRRDIQRQFLVEAVAICLAGGLLGVGVGVGGSWLTARLTGMPVTIAGDALLLSSAFATVTGVFFGWYPARQAASLDPIAALRHE